MPTKPTQFRAKQAKKKGVPLRTKADEKAVGRSRHGAKKSSAVTGKITFAERNVSERRAPGLGKTLRSERLPEPGKSGSTRSKRATRPDAPGLRKGKPRRKTAR